MVTAAQTPTSQIPTFRALIVDDDDIVRRVLSRALSDEGFECDRTFNGQHALSLLSDEVPYDLLVTDLRMPGKNGHSLSLAALKSQPQLVVIVHTGVEEPRLAKDLIFRGVDDVVFKPTNYRAFAAKARGYVARRRQLSASGVEPFEPQALLSRGTSAFGRSGESSRAKNQPLSATEVEKRLEDLEFLFPLSHVAFDVYSMATRDDCEPDDLAATIEQDASLTAEVLKLANSSHGNSRHREIESVQQAIVRLGRRSIGQLALSAGGRRALAGHDLPWIDRELLWKRSLLSAVALRTLKANAPGRDDNSDFLAALLHPVGRIVLATLFPDQHREMTDRCRATGESLDAAEKKAFGLSHGQVGAQLLSSWGVSPAAATPLQYVTTSFDQLHRQPETIRHRVENIKLSILLARMAAGRWEPWDTIDLPNGDMFDRLHVNSTAGLLSTIRSRLDDLLPNGGEEGTAHFETLDSQPVPQSVYLIRGESSSGMLPAVLSSLGVQVREHPEDDGERVIVDGLDGGAGLEQFAASQWEADSLGFVRDQQTASLFAPGAAVVLPTTIRALLESLGTSGPAAASTRADAMTVA